MAESLPSSGLPLQTLSITGDIGSMLVAGGVLVLLGLGGVALWRSGIGDRFGSGGSSAGTRQEEQVPSRPDRRSDAGSKPARSESTAGQEPAESDVSAGTGAEVGKDHEHRTDSDVVVDLLEANDGRMRQAAIVEETEWSKSKVSMVLSEMEDDGAISKLRVGRENIVSLSGNEPDAAGSPFDDE